MFLFLKYLQPTHYFQLNRKEKVSVFPKVNELPDSVYNLLEKDDAFSSLAATAYDLSWQAVLKGYIGDAPTYTAFKRLPVIDEYRFIRKNFHPIWVFYVLLLRLGSFKNPYREIHAYLKTSTVQRQDHAQQPITYPDYDNYTSKLLQEQPLVSIVIPTLNRYEYLKDVLQDLEQQVYTNFEVIIVDQSEPFQREFYKDFDLNVNLIHQEEKALWLARNKAIQESKGEYILLFDDDSRVDPDWIAEHLKTLDFFKADLSSGVSLSTYGAKIPDKYSFFCLSSQVDTGNVLLPKQIFRDIGLFDRQFEKQRMGDGEFGLRAYLAGYKNISNPKAKRIHLKVGSGGLRQMGSWDGFRPKNWLGPRPVPSVLYLFRKYHGKKAARLALLKSVPPSVMPYQFKRNSYMMLLGTLISLFLFPLVILQVNKSWRLASKKLKEGDKIEWMS